MTERKAVRYIATARGYVDGRIVDEGEAFVTTAPKGSWMEPVDKAEYEAAKATEAERDDPNYDAMTLPALQAVAAQLKVNSDGLSTRDLLTAITAAKAPPAYIGKASCRESGCQYV